MEIRPLVDFRNTLGEGPLWDPRGRHLYWVDILARAIHRTDADGGNHRTWRMPEHVGALALREHGGAVVALRTGFHFFDFDGGGLVAIHDPEAGTARTRFNDGKTDRRGRFVAGSMDYEESEGIGACYRLDPDLSCTRLASGITIFNAPCWSPDDATFYYADSARDTIFACDWDIETGEPSKRRVLVAPGTAPGAPDGCTVDADGYLWNARWGAGCIVRFAPDGTVDRTVEIPARRTTSCAFGGENLDRLYVTSMKDPDNPRDAADPAAGSIYVVDGLGVRGLPEPRFGG